MLSPKRSYHPKVVTCLQLQDPYIVQSETYLIMKLIATTKHRDSRYLLLLIVFILGLYGKSAAQDISKHIIHLQQQELTTPLNASQWLDSAISKHIGTEPLQVLLQFDQLPTAEQKELLKQKGILLLEFIPDNAFVAIITQPLAAFDPEIFSLRSIINLKPSWKLVRGLPSLQNDRKIQVQVAFLSGTKEEIVRKKLLEYGAVLMQSPLSNYSTYIIQVPANKILPLASWYGRKASVFQEKSSH